MNVIATATGPGFTIVFDQKVWSDDVTAGTAQDVVNTTAKVIQTEKLQIFKGEYSIEVFNNEEDADVMVVTLRNTESSSRHTIHYDRENGATVS